MTKNKYLVYALVDPRSQEWRYIGKSCSGLKRPKQHMSAAVLRNERSYKASWIKQLHKEGLVYQIEILEVFENEDRLSEAECEWIVECRKNGVPLTNKTDGGDGVCGYVHTKQAKDAIGSKNKGLKKPWLSKLNRSRKGQPSKQKGIPTGRSIPWSYENRVKQSIAFGGSPIYDVCCNRTFNTLGETAIAIGAKRSNVSASLAGRCGLVHGHLLRRG